MAPPRLIAVVLAAASFVVPLSLDGQDIGFHLVSAASNHLELPSPQGFALSLAAPLPSGWEGWASLHRIADETFKDGVVCRVVLADRIGCGVEPVRARVSLSGFRGGVARSLDLTRGLGARVAGGLSFNQITADANGVSGRRAEMLVPNGGQIGLFGALLLHWRPLEALPLRLAGRLELHQVRFSACAHPSVAVYDPFCEAGAFREVGLGLWWEGGGR